MSNTPHYIQHGIGPYRRLQIGSGPITNYVVGSRCAVTGLNTLPMDGAPFNVDDPVLGTVIYDGNGRRIINS